MDEIPNFTKVVKELELLECLNGKEAKCAYLKPIDVDVKHLMETCRCFQSLYEVICSARFNLICACKSDYPELLAEDSSLQAHNWIRSQYVNNAILWYSSVFEIMIQPLWLYYRVYAVAKPGLTLTTESINEIWEKCRFESIKKYGVSQISSNLLRKLDEIDTSMQTDIRIWANTLKHRKKIEYKELSRKAHPISVGGNFSLKEDINGNKTLKINIGDYNSSQTIVYVKMGDVINRLVSFHKEVIDVSKDINNEIGL